MFLKHSIKQILLFKSKKIEEEIDKYTSDFID